MKPNAPNEWPTADLAKDGELSLVHTTVREHMAWVAPLIVICLPFDELVDKPDTEQMTTKN